MEQIELSKNLARVQELAKALRITPLFERLSMLFQFVTKLATKIVMI